MQHSLNSIARMLQQHIGTHHGASSLTSPHTDDIPVVDDYSRLPAATREQQFQFYGVRSNGEHADVLYCCLGRIDNVGFDWVAVAWGGN